MPPAIATNVGGGTVAYAIASHNQTAISAKASIVIHACIITKAPIAYLFVAGILHNALANACAEISHYP
eukprot:CAMPEP_0184410790 /NCGR_PEP_ID=MMETSP0738-20130409/5168_1 /TAXON_ID=385413 /ORGANISM="Thalassiosira miniscula, Strain CCMP1093" /LENGTH=68 /DNA_ID=CAMNT_0026768877 /DNA_START=242 /DNA_END=448 /DNA_ORIENTATION=-